MTDLRTISPEFLDELIDFAPPDRRTSKSVGELQREGTVAAFNMLARNACAYLADEVGMGKTYIALGVMSLLRYFNPHARVIVIAPRANIQRKWAKELHNFVSYNWKYQGNRVKTLDGTPVWQPLVCESLNEFAHEAFTNQDRDFFLRMTSFSIACNDRETRERYRNQLLDVHSWIGKKDINVGDRDEFLRTYSVALNSAIPQADLVIVDEAHNLKHGYNDRASNRNRVMALAFGHPDGGHYGYQWFEPKAKRVLFLSATPFEDDYGAIHRQLQIFGLEKKVLTEPSSTETFDLNLLGAEKVDQATKRRIVERLMIRRTFELDVAGHRYTRNMYRREWRRGGVHEYDTPIHIDDDKTRLVVALMQKKVSELLQLDQFQNSFQIGMLSSFETFAQDVNTLQRNRNGDEDESESSNQSAAFDGTDQQRELSQEERDGIDTNVVSKLAQSYLELFRKQLPHPKLDHVVNMLETAFETGEKSLIFVRRVATIGELGTRLNRKFDEWIRAYMHKFLPELNQDISRIFERYENEIYRKEDDIAEGESTENYRDMDSDDPTINRSYEEDVGGNDSFFAWFFRGSGPSDLLSGGAFAKNRLLSSSSAYSTLFEDNYIASLLDTDPGQVADELPRVLGMEPEVCLRQLKEVGSNFFHQRWSTNTSSLPKQNVFESYQYASLTLLVDLENQLGKDAAIIRHELFPMYLSLDQAESEFPFPEPSQFLNLATFFTELRKHQSLSDSIWPREFEDDSRKSFRRREQRRELISTLSRLGRSFIDLYLLAIEQIGSFDLGSTDSVPDADEQLSKLYIDLLEQQSGQEGCHAFYELSQAASNFDTLIATNFPDIEQHELQSLSTYFGATLRQQEPVGGVSGTINARLVSQFRMPGFPLVLVSTDVLQEGEDLHTFCKNVIHYGIAWTPSAIEQRTGRVDRIGGLVQRNLESLSGDPSKEDFIQVYYPYLRDTVEMLQVRKILERLNTFLSLVHTNANVHKELDSAIDTNKSVHEQDYDVEQFTDRLNSAFNINECWLRGELSSGDIDQSYGTLSLDHFGDLINKLSNHYQFQIGSQRLNHVIESEISFSDIHSSSTNWRRELRGFTQEFTIRLVSQISGTETLIQMEGPVIEIDIEDEDNLYKLVEITAKFQNQKICIIPRVGKNLDRITIREEMLYDPNDTYIEDLKYLFDRVVFASARMHKAYLRSTPSS